MPNKDKSQIWWPRSHDFASSKEEVHYIGHVIIFLSFISISGSPCGPWPYLKIGPISRPCHCGSELLRSRCTGKSSHSTVPDPYDWPLACQPHAAYRVPTSACEQRWTLEMAIAVGVAVCLYVWQLLMVLTLHLLGHAVLLNESPINRRLDKLAEGDRHSIKLAEACNQSRKSQGPVGLLKVH